MAKMPTKRMISKTPTTIKPMKIGMVKKPVQSYAYAKVPFLTLKGCTCNQKAHFSKFCPPFKPQDQDQILICKHIAGMYKPPKPFPLAVKIF